MQYWLFFALAITFCPLLAQEKQTLETPYTPFDFDNYRRTPMQTRQSSVAWASRDSTDLQRGLISGERGKKQDIAAQAAALFPDPKEIPLHPEPSPLPSPKTLTDEITVENHGETSKGQRDLLARGRVAEKLDFDSMSDSDYELYVAQRRTQSQETTISQSGESLLRPMPTLMNSKTDGPPHRYAVSQAGVGVRTEPRNGQNPFEDLIHFLRLDKPVTKGTDPLPTSLDRTTATGSTPVITPATPVPSSSSSAAPAEEAAKP